ncbi:MAG: DUF488 domain-containing protein [Armatimonadota bacterium]
MLQAEQTKTIPQPELYTIGYEGASQEALLHTLIYYDIVTLLDIRELPQSRKPGLSKTALGLAAAQYGIRYQHIRALGTPRDIRYRRKIDHDADAFRDGYLAHLALQDEAMETLAAQALTEKCCLLCYEADAQECHRWFVAERAVEIAEQRGTSLSIIHLRIMEISEMQKLQEKDMP